MSTKNDAVIYSGRPCRECGATERYSRDRRCVRCEKVRVRISTRRRTTSQQASLRMQVFDVLGRQCSNTQCNYTDIRALQIDHINGDGARERKLLHRCALLRRVLDYPDQYQILCANCNWIKRAISQEHGGKQHPGALLIERGQGFGYLLEDSSGHITLEG